jgi:hypothetical protein
MRGALGGLLAQRPMRAAKREKWGEAMQRIMVADADNPYYQWLMGGEME